MQVEIWNSKLQQSEFFECEIINKKYAEDREFRLDVKLNHDRILYAVAPECVTFKPNQSTPNPKQHDLLNPHNLRIINSINNCIYDTRAN